MALTASTLVLVISAILIVHRPVQGQKNKSGQVVNRSRTLRHDNYRNTTFRYAHRLFSPLSFAHLYTTVNFSNSVTQFNHLVHIFDTHLAKLHSVIDDPYYNSTLSLLRAKLENGADYVRFAASVIDCDTKVASSKSSLPLINPPSSDTLFFRDLNRFDWENYYGGKENDREKRQAVLAAIALFGGVGFGVYNTAEIAYLKARLGDENNRVGLLAARLREADTTMSRHESRLFTISTKVNEILKSSTDLEVRNEVNRLISHYSLALDNVINHAHSLSDMLIQGKLQPRFFHHKSVTQAFNRIATKALKHRLIMANTQLSEILTEATSFHVDQGQIFFALHLPMHSETEFELYEFINTPFSLRNGSAVIISTPYKWLAINQALSEHIVLSDEERKKCLSKRKGLICPTSVTQRSLKATCLGSLYLGSMEHMAIHCDITPVDAFAEIVTKLDGNQVAIFSPPHLHTVAYISCPEFNESQQIIVRHHEIVQIGDACMLVTPNFIYRTDQQLAISSSFLNRRLVSVDSFQFRQIKAHATLPPFLRHDFHSSPIDLSPSHHTWLLSIIIAVLTIGLLLLIGLLCWRVRSKLREERLGREELGPALISGQARASLHLPHPQQDVSVPSRWWSPCCWGRRAGRTEKRPSITLAPPSPSSLNGRGATQDANGDATHQEDRKLELKLDS